MYYSTPYGKYEDVGEMMNTNISGAGMFPVGKYSDIEVVEADAHHITLVHKARGLHSQEGEFNFPTWLKPGVIVSVEIGLSEGCYARRNSKGEYAMFDSITQERLSEWSRDVFKILVKDMKLSTTVIKSITNGDKEKVEL